MRFTNTVIIERPRAEVFAFLAEFENIPRWNYAISGTRKVSEGPVGIGSRYRQTRTLPRRGDETFEVVEFEPRRRLAVRGDIGPFTGTVRYLLEESGEGTRVDNEADLRARGPLRLVESLTARQVKSAVAANLDVLKHLLESR